jgi:phage terminase large subunit
MNKKVQINSHFKFLYDPNINKRINVLAGGAASSKSYSVAQKLLSDFISTDGINILICRKTHNSNRNSTFPLILSLIQL